MLARWGLAAACTVFFWALASVASRVWPAVVPVRVRGYYLPQSYSSAFTLVSPAADRLILLLCSASILAILELRIRRPTYLQRAVLALPVLALAALVLSPGVLLAVGGVGTTIGILYLIPRSDALVGVPPRRLLSSVLLLLSGSAAVVFSASAARWVANALDGAKPLAGSTWAPSLLALRLLNLPYGALPALILLFLISWVLAIFIAAYRDSVRAYFARLTSFFGPSNSHGNPFLASGRLPLFVMLASLAGALFVGVYPYLQAINPGSILVGYDVRSTSPVGYYLRGTAMAGLDPLGAASYALKNDRALFLLAQYGLAGLTGSLDLAVRIVPVLLTLLLAVSIYLFVLSGTGDRLLASTASLFSACSMIVVASINAGFDPNWLATSEALIYLSLLLTGLRRGDRRYVAASAAVSVLVLFTHPWTWLATLGVLLAFAASAVVASAFTHERKNLRFELASVGAIVVVNLAADGAKRLLGASSGLADVYVSTSSSIGLANIPSVLGSLQTTVSNFLGGALDNPLLVILAIVGMLTLADLRSEMNRLLLSWTAVASAGILLSAFSLTGLQARILLLVPFQVPAAMGFLSLLRYLSGLMGDGSANERRLTEAFVILAYAAVFCAMLGYALQNVGSLYTVGG